MPDPTPAEIEAGADALDAHWLGIGATMRTTLAVMVLRAVMPDHDARVRADERDRVAEEINQHLRLVADHLRNTGQHLSDITTAELIEATVDVARAHATPPEET